MDMNERKTFGRVLGVVAALILVLPLLGFTRGRMPTESTPTERPTAVPRSDGVASDQIVDLRLPLSGVEGESAASAWPEASTVSSARTYGQLPLSFEANRGQTDGRVKFLARSRGQTLFLTPTEAVLVLTKIDARVSRDKARFRKAERARRDKVIRTAVRMKLVGANPDPQLSGLEEQPGKVNYFIGNDPAKWRTNVPTYARVEYRDAYPGVNLVYYGNQRQLEYDFVVAAGADPGVIRLSFEGVDKLTLDGHGNLVFQAAAGRIIQRSPVVYQEIGGIRREIAGRYVLRGKTRVGFQVAAYDRTKPLVIDPVLIYSTYLGGSGGGSDGGEGGRGIAVDASGNAYVTGFTVSTDFPTTPGTLQPASGGGFFQAFITKLNPTGSALVYSTYLGGSGDNEGRGVAGDAAGDAYVTGVISATDFPTTPGALQPAFGGGLSDVFATKLNATGSALVYSTYLGGSGNDGVVSSIAVDAAGNAYVAGTTDSTNFPTTPGAFQTSFSGGSSDAFITKLNPTGSALVYSTYLGSGAGSGAGSGGLAVDAAGNAYVAGATDSTNFPTTPGAFQSALSGGFDGFVTKLNSTGSSLIYSTYLGGNGEDGAASIAVDAAGNAYVAGTTDSTNFPTVNAFQPAFGGGGDDAFVTKLNPTGSALLYSTYLGGNGFDECESIAVDAAGNAYVVGTTDSTNFPTVNAFQPAFGGGDAFVTKLNPTGSALVYSTYLGGSGGAVGGGCCTGRFAQSKCVCNGRHGLDRLSDREPRAARCR